MGRLGRGLVQVTGAATLPLGSVVVWITATGGLALVLDLIGAGEGSSASV